MKKAFLKKNERVHYLDNLKAFLTILVIVFHVSLGYSQITAGMLFYKGSTNLNIPWITPSIQVAQAFFMGLFFMVSGYFAPAAFDRKGDRRFIRDRFVRLGIPLLFGAFLIMPLIIFVGTAINYRINTVNFLYQFINTAKIMINISHVPLGPLWFIEQLLVFSLLYWVLEKWIFGKRIFLKAAPRLEIHESIRGYELLLIIIPALLTASVSGLIRTWYPLNKWIYVLWFIQSEAAHLPQYVILFAVGIAAYRKDWFNKFDKKIGYLSLAAGIAMAAGICLSHSVLVYNRGIYAFYESFMAVFLCWGLLVLFREKADTNSPFIRFMADNSYAAYIFHFPLVVLIQHNIGKLHIPGAVGKFILASLLSVAATYFLSHFIRKIPGVSNVL